MADKEKKGLGWFTDPEYGNDDLSGGLSNLRDAILDALRLEMTITKDKDEDLHTYRLMTLNGEQRLETSNSFNKLGTCIPDGGKLWFCMARYAESGVTEAVLFGNYERTFLTLLRGIDMKPYANEEEFKRELDFVTNLVEHLKKNYDSLPDFAKPDYKEALEAVLKAAEARVNKMNHYLL